MSKIHPTPSPIAALDLLKQIRTEKRVYDREGNEHDFHSGIDENESRFLSDLIDRFSPNRSVEVGCAYGISSLCICQALQRNSESPHHTIIDPFQNTQWNGVGLFHLERCGFNFVDHIDELSEFALPQLLREKGEGHFDFALIDGMHTMDHTLLDMFYMTRLLKVGGLLVVDDVNMPPVNRAVRYVMNYPCYEFAGKADHQIAKKVKRLSAAQSAMRLVSHLVPKREHFFSGSVLHSHKKLGLDSSMVAIQKVAKDERKWSWYKHF